MYRNIFIKNSILYFTEKQIRGWRKGWADLNSPKSGEVLSYCKENRIEIK